MSELAELIIVERLLTVKCRLPSVYRQVAIKQSVCDYSQPMSGNSGW